MTKSQYILPQEQKLLGPNFPDSAESEIDLYINTVTSNYDKWRQINENQRGQLLAKCLTTTLEAAEGSNTVFQQYRGQSPVDESRIGWLPVVITIRHYSENLLQYSGKQPPMQRQKNINGKIVDKVLFDRWTDHLFFNGKGEIVFPKGVVPVQGPKTSSNNKVSLVLGAGNQICVPIADILQKLLMDNEVCIVKMNPVNEFLGPYLIQALKPLYDLGVFRVAYGGVDVGKYLCNHPKIDSIHLTGSDQTFNTIVWGTNDKQKIQQMNQPVIQKQVTAELGCITPYIIVPGPWSDADITYHLKTIISDKVMNSSHNCLAPELLITSKDWELRDKFIQKLRDLLNNQEQKVAWYPGTQQRLNQFMKKYPDAEQFGKKQQKGNLETFPWTLVTGLKPNDADATNEKWCGILQEIAIPNVTSIEQFLDQSVKYANEQCWGTLSCSLIIHPQTQKENFELVEKAIDNLKYGAICVNSVNSISYIQGNLPWGAYPGNSIKNIGSGNTFVMNSRMYQNLEKGIFRGPWSSPVNFYDPKSQRQIRAILQYCAFPGFLTLLKALIFVLLRL